MAEVGEMARGVDSKEFWGMLEKVDSGNLKKVADALQILAKDKGVDVHLVAVGGMVDPNRRGQPHKDIDLVLVSSALAIENDPSSEPKGFGKFEGFLNDALGRFGWSKEIIAPFWQDFDRSSDGSVTFRPVSGKPIEILPTRADSLKGSFEEYLTVQNRPFSVIF